MGSFSREMYRKRLAQIERRENFRVSSAYLTVSEPAVIVIAVIPLCMPLSGDLYISEKAKEIRQTSLIKTEAKQQSWNGESTSRWIAHLIKDVTIAKSKTR